MTESKKPESIRFHYIKGPEFRTVHVDGLVGGATPLGLVHFAMYSERFPIPQVIEQAVTKEGLLGEEIPGTRVSKDGIVRQLEIDAFMTLQVARAFYDLLGRTIKAIETGSKPG